MKQIAIIGAGLSGRLLALNLFRLAPSNVAFSIQLFDREDEDRLGPAYSGGADCLLLNVPAGRMSAFSDDPEHFLKWCRDRGNPAGPLDFLPRELYRNYILSTMREAFQARANGQSMEFICGEVTDLELFDGRVTIQVEDKGNFVAQAAVLALGNYPPRNVNIENRSVFESESYVRNPWTPDVLDKIARQDTVLIIGTGQTMVDLVVALHYRAHEGRIVALSKHGFLPLGHRRFEPYASFFGEIRHTKTILDIFRKVCRHLNRADAIGIDKRAVIDSLRPDSQTLWLELPEIEKRRFLRHLFRYWEVIRSRIPTGSEKIVDAMRQSGQLDILAGKIRNMVETKTGMEVRYTPRGSTTHETRTAARVINCIGPESDYRKVEHPLVRNMMRKGLIRPGPAYLGIDALPNGRAIGRNGSVSNTLHTIGPPLKGVLWEAIAVPEIRVQAEHLARMILEGCH